MDWLLEGPAWVQYRARRDLLGESASSAAVRAARQGMLADPQVRGLVQELADWPVSVLNSHKSAGHAIHKLTFLADLGLRADDPGMDALIARVLEHRSPEGLFQVLMNIPTHFGGTGQDQWTWALCDAPLLVYALAKFGLAQGGRVRAAGDHIMSLVRDDGWPCAAAADLGKFHGPGRREDPCPYATLVVLKMAAQDEAWRASAAARAGAEALLSLWSASRERHPYLFHMGTDFRKLKAPLLWYDILHVLEVLSQCPWVHRDARFREMLALVESRADAEGRYTPESLWKAWSAWEFGQKRAPSRWLTLLVMRIGQRVEADAT